MSATDDANTVKHLAIALIDAYVRRESADLAAAVEGITGAEAVAAATSELKVYASFLTRRVQETGMVWKPADSREAVARAVADLLEPEVEFAVINAWEAYSVGEEEAAERFTRGDPLVFMHMLAAFSAAVGRAVYSPAELVSTLRIASGISE
ncbi:hypothetical protein [Marinitenerispora sediminis]|uniref:Uncharacterized protein n=1 Tax=Marinitenerispora sediminis TaxID=1931232 RepID=A0A368T1P7_9ACTN|nr:hypothetical protein [Marinitenerispora sediminis]RCV50182.1 hypothetical protein DEF23_22510 [Marinitenerispora sediminis]RCV54535.1 hypothetical protein DEF24_19175 [Marinitenerispora sediminis]RCV56950.1 hypothetical protein DEF28_02415 [Marinitenerispora sediminis]